ncbi:IclR family transcriptional regulator [Paenalcaligenes sp. Me131]|uniref:IclR family transcriptional regulator n=1 Tax=Paenalcaligenes sp. Me131 TaxID=3392636 RepID=UPI003D2E6111
MKRGYKNNDFIRLADSPKERSFVYALGRGFELLRCFGADERFVGVAELSRRSGIPKPSVARLAGTLVKLGYLDFSPKLSKYSLGIGVVSLGHVFLSSLSVRDKLRPLLQRLAEYAQITVSLGMGDRQSIVCIDSIRGSSVLDTRSSDIGVRLPLASTSMGRAYVAGLPEAQRHVLLEQLRDVDLHAWAKTEAGITQALYDYRLRGFCVSLGEWKKGINGVAVPFFDADGNYMVVDCSAADFVLSKDKIENDIGPRVINIIKSISANKYNKFYRL